MQDADTRPTPATPTMNTPNDAFEALAEFNRKLAEQAVRPLLQASGLDVAEVFKSLVAGVAHDTGHWLEIQNDFYRAQLELWSGAAAAGGTPAKAAADAAVEMEES